MKKQQLKMLSSLSHKSAYAQKSPSSGGTSKSLQTANPVLKKKCPITI